MKTLKIKNNTGTVKVNSDEIKKILEKRDDLDTVQDICKYINEKDVMAFDCKLDEELFSVEEINEFCDEMKGKEDLSQIEELAELAELLDGGAMDIGFEDVRTYLKDATDEIESDLRDIYKNDEIRCFFNVYRIDDTFTSFKFVFVVSFKKMGIAYLTNLANAIGRKQLDGASKFYS